MSLVLDTDAFVDILRLWPPALNWIGSLPIPPMLSGVTVLESAFGAKSTADLRTIRKLESTMQVVWPDSHDLEYANTQFAQLQLKYGIGAFDAITASAAIRNDLTLVTFNLKHYRVIPGLKTIQPYKRS